MKNKYIYHAHISERSFRAILSLFCLDIEASKVSVSTGVSRQTVNKIYAALRQRISELCHSERTCSEGEFELDESYFGARRIRGIRGRGAKGKTIVFGILKRNGNVIAEVVEKCDISTLLPVIQQYIKSDSTIYTDGFKTYGALVKYGYKKHLIVNHSVNEFAKNGGVHTNGIEGFWGLCKARLAKFRGIDKNSFELYINECEFRYNHRDENLKLLLLKLVRQNPLKLS